MCFLKEKIKKHTSLMTLCRKVRSALYVFFWYPYIWYCNKQYGIENVVYCECYVKHKFYNIRINNWGDDINKFFMELVTGKKFIFVPYSKMFVSQTHYSLIGSILGFYKLNDTIIYGSGFRNPDDELNGKPLKVCSVRGPKTRTALLDRGIDCPENYGDPALLLPMFYTPKVENKTNIIIIPNMGTNFHDKNSVLHSCICELGGVLLDMTKYRVWTDIIDKIANSSLVISESLHGLIVAETYGIPNIWVEFEEHPKYWDFKFMDYYESIDKLQQKSKKLYLQYDIDELHKLAEKWEQGKINYSKMLDCFPFSMNHKIQL